MRGKVKEQRDERAHGDKRVGCFNSAFDVGYPIPYEPVETKQTRACLNYGVDQAGRGGGVFVCGRMGKGEEREVRDPTQTTAIHTTAPGKI